MPSELWCYANRAPGWDAPEPADKFDGYRLFRPGHSTSRIDALRAIPICVLSREAFGAFGCDRSIFPPSRVLVRLRGSALRRACVVILAGPIDRR